MTADSIIKRRFGNDYHKLECGIHPYEIEKAMEEYAEKKAIEFKEWCETFCTELETNQDVALMEAEQGLSKVDLYRVFLKHTGGQAL